jgi:hypothetical protein
VHSTLDGWDKLERMDASSEEYLPSSGASAASDEMVTAHVTNAMTGQRMELLDGVVNVSNLLWPEDGCPPLPAR